MDGREDLLSLFTLQDLQKMKQSGPSHHPHQQHNSKKSQGNARRAMVSPSRRVQTSPFRNEKNQGYIDHHQPGRPSAMQIHSQPHQQKLHSLNGNNDGSEMMVIMMPQLGGVSNQVQSPHDFNAPVSSKSPMIQQQSNNLVKGKSQIWPLATPSIGQPSPMNRETAPSQHPRFNGQGLLPSKFVNQKNNKQVDPQMLRSLPHKHPHESTTSSNENLRTFMKQRGSINSSKIANTQPLAPIQPTKQQQFNAQQELQQLVQQNNMLGQLQEIQSRKKVQKAFAVGKNPANAGQIFTNNNKNNRDNQRKSIGTKVEARKRGSHFAMLNDQRGGPVKSVGSQVVSQHQKHRNRDYTKDQLYVYERVKSEGQPQPPADRFEKGVVDLTPQSQDTTQAITYGNNIKNSQNKVFSTYQPTPAQNYPNHQNLRMQDSEQYLPGFNRQSDMQQQNSNERPQNFSQANDRTDLVDGGHPVDLNMPSHNSSLVATRATQSRMNYNQSNLGATEQASQSSKLQQHRMLDNFKVRNITNRIRKQKQVRRFQQYSAAQTKDQEEMTTHSKQHQSTSPKIAAQGYDLKSSQNLPPRGFVDFQDNYDSNVLPVQQKGRTEPTQQSRDQTEYQQSREQTAEFSPNKVENNNHLEYCEALISEPQMAEAQQVQQTADDKETPSKQELKENRHVKSTTDHKLMRKSLDGSAAEAHEQYMGVVHQRQGSVDSLTSSKGRMRKSNSMLPAISGRHTPRSIRNSSQGSREGTEKTPTLPGSTKRALRQFSKHEMSGSIKRFSESIKDANMANQQSQSKSRSNMVTEQYLHAMIKTPRQLRQDFAQNQQAIRGRSSAADLVLKDQMASDKLQRSIDSTGSLVIPEDKQQDAYLMNKGYSPSHLISQRPKGVILPGAQDHQKLRARRASKNSIVKPQNNNSMLLRQSSYENATHVESAIDSPKGSNPYDLRQPAQNMAEYSESQQKLELVQTSMNAAKQQQPASQTSNTPLASVKELPHDTSTYHQIYNPYQNTQEQQSYQENSGDESYSHPIPGRFAKNVGQTGKFEQWDVAGLGAVPYAINSGSKHLIFRPYYGQDITLAEAPKPPLDKGFFYRFNSNLEIKLIKYTFEDNGLCEYQQINKHQLLPNQAKSSTKDNWIIMWTTQSLKNGFFQSMNKNQKVNNFPRSIELTRKDFLANRIHRMQDAHGKHHFNFWPRTFILPKEADQLNSEMAEKPNQYWICKPSNMAQGKGIFITNQAREIPKNQSSIVSHYISNPLTVDKLKFDLRIYVAVTSINPLRIYMYDEGLVRFATAEYSAPSSDGITSQKNRFIHLTNYAINKKNQHGSIASHTAEGESHGSKWSFKALRQVLKEHSVNDERLFSRIKDIIIKTIISSEPILYSAFQMHVPHRNNCFQLFGFDVMIDDELNPWLLEVNLSPSLSCDSPLDHRIKSHLVADLFNLAGVTNIDNSQHYMQQQASLSKQRVNHQGSKLTGASAYGVNQTLVLKTKQKFAKSKASTGREKQSSLSSQLMTAAAQLGPSLNNVNNRVNGEQITKKEEIILREAEAEFKRKGRFSVIYPAAGTNSYRSYFEEPRPLNALLYKRCIEKGLFGQFKQHDRLVNGNTSSTINNLPPKSVPSAGARHQRHLNQAQQNQSNQAQQQQQVMLGDHQNMMVAARHRQRKQQIQEEQQRQFNSTQESFSHVD